MGLRLFKIVFVFLRDKTVSFRNKLWTASHLGGEPKGPPVERKTFMEVKVPKLGVGWGRARELPPTLTTKQKYLQRAR